MKYTVEFYSRLFAIINGRQITKDDYRELKFRMSPEWDYNTTDTTITNVLCRMQRIFHYHAPLSEADKVRVYERIIEGWFITSGQRRDIPTFVLTDGSTGHKKCASSSTPKQRKEVKLKFPDADLEVAPTKSERSQAIDLIMESNTTSFHEELSKSHDKVEKLELKHEPHESGSSTFTDIAALILIFIMASLAFFK